MEVTEKSAEGLDRRFTVKVPATELDEKLVARLEELKGQVHLKGFRKGKAPVSHLKKMYGKGVMGEIVQEIVNETTQKAFTDRDLQPAGSPQPEFNSDMDDVIAGKSDLEYEVHAEILPSFDPMDVSTLKLTRMTAEVADDEVQEALQRVADQQTTYAPRKETQKSKKGDMLTVNYVGSIDGEEFDGGKGEGVDIVLGSDTFIPGFEKQLTGAKAGEDVKIEVTFPEDYGANDLAGKDAVFQVNVVEVKEPAKVEIDDELAKKMGLDSLDDLKKRISERIEEENKQLSRGHLKRALLDQLDSAHDFDLPKGMVDSEFDQIWQQVESAEREEEDEGKSDDELKAEYRTIAERRVRLGLVLAEIGKRADVQVPQEDLQREMINMARAYPGKEKEVLEFYQSNPAAVQQLRAPIFEEKVVDYIVERAEVEDKQVSKEKLQEDPDGDE